MHGVKPDRFCDRTYEAVIGHADHQVVACFAILVYV